MLSFDNISVKEIDVDPSTARYLPRIGHHVYNGSQWVNEGLLHESGARTNLVTYSEDLSNSAWDKSRCSVAADGVGPDGAASLYTVTATETNANGMSVQETVTVTSGATATASGFARKCTDNWMLVVAYDGSSNGTRHVGLIFPRGLYGSSNTVGTGWSKVGATITDQGNDLYRWSFTVEVAQVPALELLYILTCLQI